MSKSDIFAWIEEGNISIPNALLTNYKQLGLTEQQLVMLLHMFSFIEKGIHFPTPNEFAVRMTMPEAVCSEMLSGLIQRGFIGISDGNTSDGIRYEIYSLQPLIEKITEQFLRNRKEESRIQRQAEEVDLYSTFEQEFGRPLSPYECETLAIWMDDDSHEEAIIKEALREAVMSSKLNFRYIDRILFDWKRNGIQTIEQARQQGKKFRAHQGATKQPSPSPKENPDAIPLYNWLEQ